MNISQAKITIKAPSHTSFQNRHCLFLEKRRNPGILIQEEEIGVMGWSAVSSSAQTQYKIHTIIEGLFKPKTKRKNWDRIEIEAVLSEGKTRVSLSFLDLVTWQSEEGGRHSFI